MSSPSPRPAAQVDWPVFESQAVRLRAGAGRVQHPNIGARLNLVGELDRDALIGACRGLLARHAVLATRFWPNSAGEWRQGPADDPAFLLKCHDLSGMEPADQAAALRDLTRTAFAAPFELMSAAKIRFALIRCGVSRHRLNVVVDHLVADEWSVGLILRDLCRSYNDAVRGRPRESLPSGPTAYELAARERQRLLDGEFEGISDALCRDLAFGNPYAEVNLPGPFEAAAGRRCLTEVRFHRFEPQALDGLRARSALPVTDLMVLTAMVASAVSRTSGDPKVVFLSNAANRQRHTAQVVGWLANPVTVGVTSPSGGLVDGLDDARRAWLLASRHADVPGNLVRRHRTAGVRRPSVSIRWVDERARPLILAGLAPVNVGTDRPVPHRGGVGPPGRIEFRALRRRDEIEVQMITESGRFPAEMLRELDDQLGVSIADGEEMAGLNPARIRGCRAAGAQPPGEMMSM